MRFTRFTKANIFAMAILFATTLTISAQSMMEHALTQRYNHDTGSWEEVYQAIMSYDENGNEVGTITQNWSREQTQWTNNNKCTNTFDEKGNKLAAECLAWEEATNSWVKSYRFEFTHNSDNQKTVFLDLRWNEETGTWDKQRKDTYEYNADGKCKLYTWYKFESTSGDWMPNMKVEYLFDEEGIQTEQRKADFKNGDWLPSWRNIYEFDEKGEHSGKVVMHWNAKKASWTENSRWDYVKENGKVVSSNKTDFVQGNWNHSQEVSYQYDKQGRKIEKLSVTKTSRGAEDHLMRTRYVYKEAPDLSTLQGKTAAELSNYPNPFDNLTTIRFEVAEEGRLQIQLFDLQGKLIREIANGQYMPGVYEIGFEAGDLVSGIYHYSMIMSDGRSISRKMVITGN